MGYSKKFYKKMERMMINTYVRTMYSESLSSLVMSHYNTNFSLCFNRWVVKDSRGFDVYDTTNGLSTTLNYENASLLFQVAMSILSGANAENEVRVTLQCNNAELVFDYKHKEDGTMAAFLTINKNNQSILFEFITDTFQVKKNGQKTTLFLQTGLNVLAEVLHGYLSGIGTDRHLNKLSDYYATSKCANQNYSTGNNSGYQGGSW